MKKQTKCIRKVVFYKEHCLSNRAHWTLILTFEGKSSLVCIREERWEDQESEMTFSGLQRGHPW
jgi:hypothetical protein